MNNEKLLKDAIVNICTELAKNLISKIEYDYHIEGEVLSLNEDGTFDLYCENRTLAAVSALANITDITEGSVVTIRATNHSTKRYVIDGVVRYN